MPATLALIRTKLRRGAGRNITIADWAASAARSGPLPAELIWNFLVGFGVPRQRTRRDALLDRNSDRSSRQRPRLLQGLKSRVITPGHGGTRHDRPCSQGDRPVTCPRRSLFFTCPRGDRVHAIRSSTTANGAAHCSSSRSSATPPSSQAYLPRLSRCSRSVAFSSPRRGGDDAR